MKDVQSLVYNKNTKEIEAINNDNLKDLLTDPNSGYGAVPGQQYHFRNRFDKTLNRTIDGKDVHKFLSGEGSAPDYYTKGSVKGRIGELVKEREGGFFGDIKAASRNFLSEGVTLGMAKTAARATSTPLQKMWMDAQDEENPVSSTVGIVGAYVVPVVHIIKGLRAAKLGAKAAKETAEEMGKKNASIPEVATKIAKSTVKNATKGATVTSGLVVKTGQLVRKNVDEFLQGVLPKTKAAERYRKALVGASEVGTDAAIFGLAKGVASLKQYDEETENIEIDVREAFAKGLGTAKDFALIGGAFVGAGVGLRLGGEAVGAAAVYGASKVVDKTKKGTDFIVQTGKDLKEKVIEGITVTEQNFSKLKDKIDEGIKKGKYTAEQGKKKLKEAEDLINKIKEGEYIPLNKLSEKVREKYKKHAKKIIEGEPYVQKSRIEEGDLVFDIGSPTFLERWVTQKYAEAAFKYSEDFTQFISNFERISNNLPFYQKLSDEHLLRFYSRLDKRVHETFGKIGVSADAIRYNLDEILSHQNIQVHDLIGLDIIRFKEYTGVFPKSKEDAAKLLNKMKEKYGKELSSYKQKIDDHFYNQDSKVALKEHIKKGGTVDDFILNKMPKAKRSTMKKGFKDVEKPMTKKETREAIDAINSGENVSASTYRKLFGSLLREARKRPGKATPLVELHVKTKEIVESFLNKNNIKVTDRTYKKIVKMVRKQLDEGSESLSIIEDLIIIKDAFRKKTLTFGELKDVRTRLKKYAVTQEDLLKTTFNKKDVGEALDELAGLSRKESDAFKKASKNYEGLDKFIDAADKAKAKGFGVKQAAVTSRIRAVISSFEGVPLKELTPGQKKVLTKAKDLVDSFRTKKTLDFSDLGRAKKLMDELSGIAKKEGVKAQEKLARDIRKAIVEIENEIGNKLGIDIANANAMYAYASSMDDYVKHFQKNINIGTGVLQAGNAFSGLAVTVGTLGFVSGGPIAGLFGLFGVKLTQQQLSRGKLKSFEHAALGVRQREFMQGMMNGATEGFRKGKGSLDSLVDIKGFTKGVNEGVKNGFKKAYEAGYAGFKKAEDYARTTFVKVTTGFKEQAENFREKAKKAYQKGSEKASSSYSKYSKAYKQTKKNVKQKVFTVRKMNLSRLSAIMGIQAGNNLLDFEENFKKSLQDESYVNSFLDGTRHLVKVSAGKNAEMEHKMRAINMLKLIDSLLPKGFINPQTKERMFTDQEQIKFLDNMSIIFNPGEAMIGKIVDGTLTNWDLKVFKSVYPAVHEQMVYNFIRGVESEEIILTPKVIRSYNVLIGKGGMSLLKIDLQQQAEKQNQMKQQKTGTFNSTYQPQTQSERINEL